MSLCGFSFQTPAPRLVAKRGTLTGLIPPARKNHLSWPRNCGLETPLDMAGACLPSSEAQTL